MNYNLGHDFMTTRLSHLFFHMVEKRKIATKTAVKIACVNETFFGKSRVEENLIIYSKHRIN